MNVLKYNRLALSSLLSFILGCSLTSFFLKIDDSQSVSRSNFRKEASSLALSTNGMQYTMIVLVVTSPKNVDRRSAIRKSWFHFCSTSTEVRCLFFVGVKNLGESQTEELKEEHSKFKDLILLPNIVDSYEALADKVLASFVWISENISSYQYVLKCDDDSFVRVHDIISELETRFNNGKGRNLHWGFFDGRAQVKKKGKWQESKWNLCDRYLPYALGGGYILGQKLVTYLAKNSKDLKSFANEDVSVGIWLAPVEVNRQHDCRFDTEYLSRGCSNQYLVTHKKLPEDMATLYDSLQKTNRLCRKEYNTRPSYIYNWNVPPSKCCSRSNASGLF